VIESSGALSLPSGSLVVVVWTRVAKVTKFDNGTTRCQDSDHV